ncbi:MAG: putative ionic transporter [Marmoricola sp.]|nr:putative ionic transporter [Marmoricola sp.]
MRDPHDRRLSWTEIAPPLALVALAVTWGRTPGAVGLVLVAVMLGAAVLAAVHHAEVVAHRVGEPFGSLVLAVAVTVIEVALILTLMLGGGPDVSTLARDTVFAAVMITCNGIVGLSLLVGAVTFGTTQFNAEGTGGALACVITLATTCLVLPNYTTTTRGPEFSGSQLAFVALASLALYALFVVTQTVRHRDFFLPVGTGGETLPEEDHAARPSIRRTWISLALLVVSLVAVVGLAKIESKPIEKAVSGAGLPQAVVGVVIALLVLLPESIAAINAARRGRTQISLNLGLGSAMASIGLTIPTIAVATIWLDGPLNLGLDQTHVVLLALTAVISVLTVVPGRATRLQGGVHLVVMAAYLVLSVQP